MVQTFTSFLLSSVIGTALALILTLLRPVTRKFFSGTWHYYIWLVVLLVMTFPIRISLPEASLNNSPSSEAITVINDQPKAIENTVAVDAQTNSFIQEQPTQPEKVSMIQTAKGLLNNSIPLFSLIWLSGAILLFLVKMINYFIFLIKIRRHSALISCPEALTCSKKSMKTRVSDSICSPLMVGIFKPTLLLPKTDITPEQLYHILAHETTHLKRNDVLYKWFACIAKCIHWYNPAIYLINKQINIDCEISCDLAVVKGMTEQEQKGYIETILALLTRNNAKPIPLTTGMTGNKKTLIKRFSMIRNKINISKKAKVISVILAVILCMSAVLVSGIIIDKFHTSDRSLLHVTTDERKGYEFNFLMIGVDSADRVDTILALNFDGEILTCMNIPRNIALAASPDVPVDNRIKTLSTLLSEENGDQKIIDSIKNTLGIPIHYYARVKMDAIADIIDSVGGIEFDVPYRMAYDDPAQDLHIDLKEGKQLLNGKQVEHLLRFRDRKHPNGDEIRVMTWHSVIKEFLNQVIIGKKINHISGLYEIATKNVKTNYPSDVLSKDFNRIKNINRNNIVIENIRGKNVVLNGYFVFHINFVDSEPLLKIFHSPEDGSNLISAIPYTNESMGFKITLPERWKSKYQIIQFDNQVAFFHKEIFLKHGKGSGNLFSITKIAPPTENNLAEAGELCEYLYWGKHSAYVWFTPSDIQYPIWENSDEEDTLFANDYEDMMMDLNFIKNSFSLLDEPSLYTPADQVSKQIKTKAM